MRKQLRAILPLALICLATLFLAGCGENLFDKVGGFWELSCCGAVLVILDVVALVELAGSPRPTSNKVIWALIIIFLPYLGCFLYYFFGR